MKECRKAAKEQLEIIELREAEAFLKSDASLEELSSKEARRMKVLIAKLKAKEQLEQPDYVEGDLVITQLGRERRKYTAVTERICLYRKRMKGYANPANNMTPDGKITSGKRGEAMF